MSLLKRKMKGFTLIELLIVVAIIGVLATIGIPTFRKMVQKAKKSEAKLALGGLYTTEMAFFSEYGVFGNRLTQIGFTLDGSAVSRIYTVGFPEGNSCAASTMMPSTSVNAGLALNQVFPAYFTTWTTGPGENYFPATRPMNFCYGPPNNVNTSGSDFVATATGIIAPGITDSQVSSTNTDYWSMDRNRVLTNVHDGVQ